MSNKPDTGEADHGVHVRADELERLMLRYQQGDAEATAALIRKLSPQIFGFYLNQSRDRASAEDLLQDFWLRLHKARHTFRPGEPLLPWAYSIARRVQIDGWRRQRRIRNHEVAAPELPDVASASVEPSYTPDLERLLATLPPSQREIVVLLKVNGLTLEEAARATGSTVGAVKQKAFRAYQSLRKLFGSES